MSTRTFPQEPNTSSHPRPDRRRWSWIIGGVFAVLFVLGLAVSRAQPPEDESSRPVPTEQAEPVQAEPAQAVLDPQAAPRRTQPPTATFEAPAPEVAATPALARPRDSAYFGGCDPAHGSGATLVQRGDRSEPDRDGGGCAT